MFHDPDSRIVLGFDHDEFQDCEIGVTADNRTIYSYDLLIAHFARMPQFTLDDAIEWVDFNIVDLMPMIVVDFDGDEVDTS